MLSQSTAILVLAFLAPRWQSGAFQDESSIVWWIDQFLHLLPVVICAVLPVLVVSRDWKPWKTSAGKKSLQLGGLILAAGTTLIGHRIVDEQGDGLSSVVMTLLSALLCVAAAVTLFSLRKDLLRTLQSATSNGETVPRSDELLTASWKIKEYDERLRLALHAGRMGTWDWDLRTNVIQIDAGETELTGLGKKRNGITPEQFLERIHREDREQSRNVLRKSIEDGTPYEHSFRMYVPGKGYRWLQGRGTVMLNSAGEPQRLVGVHFDMTEQMEGEETLHVLTRAIEFATNGIVITDARGEDEPMIYVNSAFEQLTGYKREQVLGKNCRILQGPQTDPAVVRQLREAINKRQEVEVTILNYRKDGTPFWNQLHLAPVFSEYHQVSHFVGVLSDITPRVANEQRLIEAQKVADAANQAKSEFLANMSHEIRTPLTAILGCADSLCLELAGDRSRNTAKTIRSQGELLLGILNDILDLSKIEAGKMEIHREACSLTTLMADVRSLMEPLATEKGIQFATHFDSALPESIETDPVRFRQVLLNLTSNAIKFTEQGCVSVHCSLRRHKNRPYLEISVSDTGIGIPDDQLSSIFEAFTQVNGSAIRRTGGTGLGLTICQRLVKMLEGDLSVTSEMNVGSTFTVTFPTDDDRELVSPNQLALQQSNKESRDSVDVLVPARVLIAEDTKAIQFMLTRILEPYVSDLKVVDNGQEAVAAVEQAAAARRPFDIVLMDMQMPILSGHDATVELRRRGFEVPIIALTAGAMAGDRERCLSAGCTDYLSKPVSRGQLIGMISTYCNSGARTSP